MRFEVVKEFSEWLTTNGALIERVAVVGGTSKDPEVSSLRAFDSEIVINYFGIDNPHLDEEFTFLDLNHPYAEVIKKYDLVLCSQVLEHVHNLENTFENLRRLTKQGGFLWINCPTSNIVHGSPHYYSAGYAPDFIVENLTNRNFNILKSMSIGSKRYYFMTHILRFWPTELEHKRPVLGYNFQPGTFLGVTRKLILDLPGRFLSLGYSKKISGTLNYSTESIVLAQSKES